MKTAETLRVGIVGCGKISQVHISSILKIRHAELVAVCDVNENLAKQTADRFNIGSYHTDFSELLLKEQVDVVHVTTPPQTHLALCTQAMEAGCHVLVEKPMALSLSEVDSMIEAARINKVRLCAVHNAVFAPVIIRAKSMIEKGVIGDLIGVSITQSLPRECDLTLNKGHWCHKLPGGIFGEMLPHSIYLATAFLSGLEVNAVYSQKLGSYDWLTTDELRVILKGNNSVGTITSSVNGPNDILAVDILGTKANLQVGISSGVMIRHIVTRGGRFSRGLDNIWTAFQWSAGTASTTLNVILGRHHDGHYNLIKRFIESLRDDTELPVTVEEAREAVRLYEAITSQI